MPWHRPMSGRDPEEAHRSATPLELFFDLCFVVAVAAAAATLHHDLAHGHLSGLAGYAMVFFAIWWAWVNYSWFASAYDTDDVIFRLLTFVVMTGVLVVAAGTPQAAGEEHDFWIARRRLRDHAGRDDPAVAPGGPRAPRARGVRRCGTPAPSRSSRSSGCSARSSSPTATHRLGLFVALALLEMAVPYWAEHAGDDALAPAPHRRALRAVHDHRARRGHPRDHPGDLGHPGRARPRDPAVAADPRRPAAGVLDVVDLLQAADGRLGEAGDGVRLRLRALLRVRLRRGGRSLPGGARGRRRAPGARRATDRRAAAGRGPRASTCS